MPPAPWLPPAFFLIALVYSTAGFGGGSSYLALLSVSGLPATLLRPVALLCNLLVTGSGSLRFARAGLIPWRRAGPLVLGSLPAAYLGGRIALPQQQYLLLLGGLLLAAGVLLLTRRPAPADDPPDPAPAAPPPFLLPLLTGAAIGFLAGLVGIGGGIFLSPLLFLTHWATARQIAATTSLFIALNSVAGLAGQLSAGLSLQLGGLLPLAVAVFAGGWLGTRLTLRWLSPAVIRKVAGALILLVGLRLVIGNLPFFL